MTVRGWTAELGLDPLGSMKQNVALYCYTVDGSGLGLKSQADILPLFFTVIGKPQFWNVNCGLDVCQCFIYLHVIIEMKTLLQNLCLGAYNRPLLESALSFWTHLG